MLYEDYQNASLDLHVNQGTDFVQEFQLLKTDGSPLELTTDLELSVVIKKYYNTLIQYPATVIITQGLAGQAKIKIPSSTTSLFTAARYVYQINLSDGAEKVCVLDGQILIDRF